MKRPRPIQKPRPPARFAPAARAALGPAGGIRVCLSTAPARAALRIARALVRERLAACVNVVRGVSSTYRWRGAVERSAEVLLVVKTTRRQVRACLRRLAALHPYEVPEALVLRPDTGLRAYLAWVEGCCGS